MIHLMKHASALKPDVMACLSAIYMFCLYYSRWQKTKFPMKGSWYPYKCEQFQKCYKKWILQILLDMQMSYTPVSVQLVFFLPFYIPVNNSVKKSAWVIALPL